MLTYRTSIVGPLFANPSATVAREIIATLAEVGAMGLRLLVERTPAGVSSGGGGLRGSMFTELRGQQDLFLRGEQVITSGLFYAPMVETGRAAGKMPPTAALRLWVQRRVSGVTEANLGRVTFVIARKIGLVGSRGAFMFQRTFTQLAPIARQRFDALAARLATVLGGA
jgi:hypothetical protein